MTYQDDQQTEASRFENFDAVYRRERELHVELERIEMAYVKTVEKYEDYSDCKSFVEYLRTIEKVFTEAKLRNWDAEKNKDELIKYKMKSLAEEGGVAEDVLTSIYNDFKKASTNIGKISEIVNGLIEKYNDSPACTEFILYMQYLFINFQNAESADDLRERLIKARIEVLSSSGNPDMMTLENIYKEFKTNMQGA